MFSNIFPKIVVFMNNVGKYSRAVLVTDDHTTRRMRFACWITMATHTHSGGGILIRFPKRQLLHEPA